MKNLILGTISALLCLSSAGAWALEKLPESRHTIAKSDSHVLLRRLLGANLKSYTHNDDSDWSTTGESSSKDLEADSITPSISREVRRGPPPVFLASAGMAFMRGSSKSNKAPLVQLNPNPEKSTYTWKDDHYEKIQPYGFGQRTGQ